MKHQQGLSLFAIVLVLAVVGAGLLLAMKVAPVYSEYAEVRQTLLALSTQTNAGDAGLRRGFDNKASVAGITSIKGENLTVVAGNNENYLRATYRREVPLFGNVSLLFNFDTQAGQPPAQP